MTCWTDREGKGRYSDKSGQEKKGLNNQEVTESEEKKQWIN